MARARRRQRLITEERLLALAAQWGRPVTHVQLLSWRRRGLVPSPVRRFEGRGTGSRTLGYPGDTFPRVVAIASALRRKRSLDEAVWWMWLAGFDVTTPMRDVFQRTADRWANQLSRDLDAEAAATEGEGEQAGSDFMRRLVYGRPPSWLAPLRRRLRGRKREAFETVVFLVLEALAGQGDPTSELLDEAVTPFRQVLATTLRRHPLLEQDSLRQAMQFSLGELRLNLNAPRLAEDLGIADDDTLTSLRDQFLAWFALADGASFLPLSIRGYLLWFALRYSSPVTSVSAFPGLQQLLHSQHEGALSQLVSEIQSRLWALLLMPQVEGDRTNGV